MIVLRRHVASVYDLEEREQVALWQLVEDARSRLLDKFAPDGFNIGLNDSTAAGQTVTHAHIDVIPRYEGDVDDPRGGVRWVIPDNARYW